jgi:hypothetical protein
MCRPTQTAATLDKAGGSAIISPSDLEYQSTNRPTNAAILTPRDVSTLRSFARVTPRSALTADKMLRDWIISANYGILRYYERHRHQMPTRAWLAARGIVIEEPIDGQSS